VAAILTSSRWHFAVEFVGPGERVQLTPAALRSAILYAQPGGDGTVERAFGILRSNAQDIRDFVDRGGRYLGFCMGGYLAGATPGFRLFPGDTNQYVTSPGASVTTTRSSIVEVKWRGQERRVYSQDPPFFILNTGAAGVSVLARYTNGAIAALVAEHGSGRVGLVGPHPEATSAWFERAHLSQGSAMATDLALDLVDSVMR
jgi:glutamine amidotransferase-like uncharacterized protein